MSKTSSTSAASPGKNTGKSERMAISSGVAYEVSELANGVRIATAEMPHMASVSVGFWTSVGSRHEQEGEHGVAHFVEHLLFKGTASRTASAIAREVEGLGGSLDAYTSEDHTCYYAKGPAELFESMTDVLADMYQHPVLAPADIENERSVIKEEIAMVLDQPSQYLDDLLSNAAWGEEHPLGRSITGTAATLDGLGQGELKRFFEQGYVASNTIVSVAGNVTHQQALDVIAPRLEKLPSGKRSVVVPPGYRDPSLCFCVDKRDIEQTHFSIGFHAFHRHQQERYAQKLLSVLLGENMSSLLFQQLREEEAVCYSVQSDVMTFDDAGLFHIYCALDPDHLPRALEVITATLKDLRQKLPDKNMLEEAKAYTIGQSRIALENTSSQMTWLGESVLSYNRLIDPADSQERMEAVQGDDIHRVAAELFDPERLVIAAVGPEGMASALEEWRGTFRSEGVK